MILPRFCNGDVEKVAARERAATEAYLFKIPNASLGVDVFAEIVEDLFPRLGDADEGAAGELEAGGIIALGDLVEERTAHLEVAGVELGLEVGEVGAG